MRLTTIIKPTLRDQLKHLAIEKNKSLTDMIEEMIEHYIKKHEK
ncbi:MAG: ribbon-helix-helix protein, CopG family [Flavobacteriales bacterium]